MPLVITNKKNYLYSIISSFGGIAISTGIGIVAVPISLHYWGSDKYGIWAVINSLLVYLNMSNLGLSTSASVLMAKNNCITDKLIILKRASHILVGSVLALMVTFLTINYFTKSWMVILGEIPQILQKETYTASLLLAVFFFINLPFSLLGSAFLGFQKLYIENVFALVTPLLNFLALLIVVYIKADLVVFAIVLGFTTLTMNLIKLSYFYFFIFKKVQRETTQESTGNGEISYGNIFKTGLRFFVVGVAAMVVWNTDLFVISGYLGIQYVAAYSITFKLYQFAFGLIFAINNSAMPLLAREFGNCNWSWINASYERLLVIMAIIGGALWLGGSLFLKEIVLLWTGPQGYAGFYTVLALGGYGYLLSMVNLNAGLVSSFNYNKLMPYVSWIEALAKFCFSVILMHVFGISGVAIGTFLGSMLTVSWMIPLILMRYSGGKIQYNVGFISSHFLFCLIPHILLSIGLELTHISEMIRIILAIGIFLSYCFFSFKRLPITTKDYIVEYFSAMLIRRGLKF